MLNDQMHFIYAFFGKFPLVSAEVQGMLFRYKFEHFPPKINNFKPFHEIPHIFKHLKTSKSILLQFFLPLAILRLE